MTLFPSAGYSPRMSSNMFYRSHPWHGLSLGEKAPEIVNCYIEIVSTDTVKYELDKETGLLKVDRPQKYSSVCPCLYGLLPKTLCNENIGRYCQEKTGKMHIVGDQDPMDICVLTEKVFSHGDIILKARPIGGFRLIDGNQADDKIIAVLVGDAVYGNMSDLSECPEHLIERLRHYFLTYKDSPDRRSAQVEIAATYGAKEAHKVIQLSQKDYNNKFGE